MTRLTDSDELLLESSGAPVSEFDEIAVLDDAGLLVPDGEAGELVTRGPYTIHGYYNAEKINAESFTAARTQTIAISRGGSRQSQPASRRTSPVLYALRRCSKPSNHQTRSEAQRVTPSPGP
jgi:acyl-CoA synthetase (AMP-forming)/AMP-acid ligase II